MYTPNLSVYCRINHQWLAIHTFLTTHRSKPVSSFAITNAIINQGVTPCTQAGTWHVDATATVAAAMLHTKGYSQGAFMGQGHWGQKPAEKWRLQFRRQIVWMLSPFFAHLALLSVLWSTVTQLITNGPLYRLMVLCTDYLARLVVFSPGGGWGCYTGISICLASCPVLSFHVSELFPEDVFRTAQPFATRLCMVGHH